MQHQTVFYVKETGNIINILPNKYISSKFEKVRLNPGYSADEINFLYYKTDIAINKDLHRVEYISATQPPRIIDENGISLIYQAIKLPFLKTIETSSNLIIDMADSMGDNLYRAAAVIEAQKVYPSLSFFCKVLPEYRDIMALIPDITLFTDYKALNLDPKECATVKMPAAHFINPQDLSFSAPSGYGLYLGLNYVPYTLKLSLPVGFSNQFAKFSDDIGLHKAGLNMVFQFRTKNEESRSWDVPKALELAHLIKANYDCTIFWLGSNIDFTGDHRDITNLAGKTTWLETAYLLKAASHVFCIDSSILHLCHALNIKPFRLWGRTNPQSVLGETPAYNDIFSAENPLQSNIKAIYPDQVFKRAFHDKPLSFHNVPVSSHDYSQHGEQNIIFKHFQDHPPGNNTIVDVGAFGKEISNTYALLQQGWKGLLIEASPIRQTVVEKDFSGLDVKILGIGISDKADKLPFYIHSVPGHDSFDPDWYPQTMTDKVINIDVYPLHKVLKDNNIPLDFALLSIDTEGYDKKILKKLFTASKYRPSLIVCEWNSDTDETGLFSKYGYTQIGKTGAPGFENLIFALLETASDKAS